MGVCATMRQSGEPTVEEILESIKKVIARDNRAIADERGREASALRGEKDGYRADDTDDILDLDEAAEIAECDSQTSETTEPVPLLGDEARNSMRDSLAALAMLSGPGAQPQILRSGETSLEGMVRDLLRPALAEWLDKNLPPLVERMVAHEISRIVGKRG